MPKSFNIRDFTSKASTRGILSPSKFNVTITTPQALSELDPTFAGNLSNELSFWCTSSSIPGISVDVTEVRRYGGVGISQKKPYSVSFAPIKMSVVASADSATWMFFKWWFQTIFNFDMSNKTTLNYGNGNQDVYENSYTNDYAVEMAIRNYDNVGNSSTIVKLRQAFPIGMSNLEFDWSTNGLVSFNVVVTYTDFKVEQSDVSGLITTLT